MYYLLYLYIYHLVLYQYDFNWDYIKYHIELNKYKNNPCFDKHICDLFNIQNITNLSDIDIFSDE